MEGEGWARGEGLAVASMPPRALACLDQSPKLIWPQAGCFFS